MTIEGTPRATRGHQICVWCKKGHRSTKPRGIGGWTGMLDDACARKMRTEYEKGLGDADPRTEKARRKEMTRIVRLLNNRTR